MARLSARSRGPVSQLTPRAPRDGGPGILLFVRRRLWIAFGLSGLAHLAMTLALLLPRLPAPFAASPPAIEIELLAGAEPEAPPALPPQESPAPRADSPASEPAPRTRTPARRPAAAATTAEATAEPTAPVAPASTDRLATFKPRHLALGPKPPAPPPGPRPGSLEALFNPAPDVLHHRTTDSLVGVKRQGNGLQARVAPDGRISFDDPPAVKYTGLGLRFDVTELAMRAIGDDPYAAQKARIAAETREARFCLTLKEAEGDKRNAVFRLKDNLERIAADPSLPAAAKRAAVFDLWEGCLDTSDDALASAARATIVAFIRRAFPAGSPTAYTPVELALLNRRRNCTRPFDPYTARATVRRLDAGADPQ